MSAPAAHLTRRALLAGASTLLLGPSPALARPQRIAAVDWAHLETLLVLGAPAAAAVELVLFRQIAVEPAVPPSVIDLGLRGSMNFELLSLVAPDLIYSSPYASWAEPLLARIAPVRSITIYESGVPPFARAEEAMRLIARDLGLTDRAEAYIATTHADLAARSKALEQHADRPVFLVNIGDPRHVRAFGDDSMFGDVLARLGFRNAWGPRTSYSATAPVEIEALAAEPDAFVAIVGPVPPDARRVLPESALWRALPAVREDRVLFLDPINPFGGLPAARRFARLFTEALLRETGQA